MRKFVSKVIPARCKQPNSIIVNVALLKHLQTFEHTQGKGCKEKLVCITKNPWLLCEYYNRANKHTTHEQG